MKSARPTNPARLVLNANECNRTKGVARARSLSFGLAAFRLTDEDLLAAALSRAAD
jgi:hypothetical protein